jgi:hypothetical protein
LSPRNTGEQQRAANRGEIIRLLGSSLHLRQINPYRYAEFVGELSRLVEDLKGRTNGSHDLHLVIDITCLTKIHTLALAYWLLTSTNLPGITLAYSQPDYYGNPSKNIWGRGKWQTTSLVRLDLDSTERFLTTAAIVLLGHEGDRLRLALNEIEASEALVIKTLPRDKQSKLLTVSDVQNSWLFQEMRDGVRDGFVNETVGMRDLHRLSCLVIKYCRSAKEKGARIVVCPFGPKTFVFVAGYSCLSVYPENTWLSYPRPVSYDPQYSEGYKYTLWFDPS